MEQWSAQEVTVDDPPGYMSLEWMKGVLEKLGEEGGGDHQCLGRRMRTFESVEAEGRQFGRDVQGRLFGKPRVEGQEVPTRVLFDRRDDVMAMVKKKSGRSAGGVSVSGAEENKATADPQMTSTPPPPPPPPPLLPTTADSASSSTGKGKQKEEEKAAAGTAESNPDKSTAAVAEAE